jgi:hypothetical protein
LSARPLYPHSAATSLTSLTPRARDYDHEETRRRFRAAEAASEPKPFRPGILVVLLLLTVVGLFWCPNTHAQDALAAETFVRTYATRESVWTASGRTDLFGARLHSQLGLGHLGVGIRGAASGLPGTFDSKDTKTYHSLEAYLEAHYNLATSGTATLAAAVLGGRSTSFDTAQSVVTQPNGATVGAGLVVAAPKAYALLAFGRHQNIRGFAVLGTVQIPMAGNVSLVADFAAGGRSQSFARVGFAVGLQ